MIVILILLLLLVLFVVVVFVLCIRVSLTDMHSLVIDMIVRIMFGILFALYIMGNDIRRLITRSRHLSIRISLSINLSNTNSMCLYITRVASLVGRR